MNILLTGANGFIGKNFLDLTSSKSISTLSRKPFAHKNSGKNYVGDLRDKNIIEKLKNEKFDRIIHAAWVGLPVRSQKINAENYALMVNIIQEFESLASTEHIFIGSCLEYGEMNGKINEKSLGANIGDFGQTKREIYNYLLKSEVKFSWIRPFYLYGPYQHSNSLLNYTLNSIINKKVINITNPSLSHDFVYIKDFVNFIDLIINKQLNNEVYNLGSGFQRTVGDFVNNILISCNQKPVYKTGSTEAAIADMDKVKQIFQWSPKYMIERGIPEVVKKLINQ